MSEALLLPSADDIITAANDVSALESLRIETAKDYEKTAATMRWLFLIPLVLIPLALCNIKIVKIANASACLLVMAVATRYHFRKRGLAERMLKIEDAIHIAKNKHLTRHNTSIPDKDD